MPRRYKNKDAYVIDKNIFNNDRTCNNFTVSYNEHATSSDQSSTGGMFVSDNVFDNSKDLYEPLVPDTSPIVLQQGLGGTNDSYSYVWISHDKYPMKSIVDFDGMKLSVHKIEDYKKHFDIYLYYLQGESDNNAVPS